jgi:hypothetical protein
MWENVPLVKYMPFIYSVSNTNISLWLHWHLLSGNKYFICVFVFCVTTKLNTTSSKSLVRRGQILIYGGVAILCRPILIQGAKRNKNESLHLGKSSRAQDTETIN